MAMKRERRLAVTLHLQGHTVPEAARILDWAAKQTENLVYRGLADLRACLMAKGIRP
jgi:RNA polymerase sigma-70 factor (ECF subfamily)